MDKQRLFRIAKIMLWKFDRFLRNKPIETLLILIAGIVLSFLLYGCIVFLVTEKPGTFGDTFGGLNAIFSGIAMAGVIVALFLQKRELELQRKEISHNRQELHRTANSQEELVRAYKAQVKLAEIGLKKELILASIRSDELALNNDPNVFSRQGLQRKIEKKLKDLEKLSHEFTSIK